MGFVGKWKVLTKTPMGMTEAIWDITEEKGSYYGRIFADGSWKDFETVNVEGNHFEMVVQMKTPLGNMRFQMEGDVNEESVSGTSKMTFGKTSFEGTRIAECAELDLQTEAELVVEENSVQPEIVAISEAQEERIEKKKVLGISCGRPFGNSELLLREALMGAEEAGAEVELLRLNDFDIKTCKGCTACFANLGQGKGNQCVQKDDFPLLLDRVLWSDAVIFSVPVYLIRPVASFLVLTDRIGPWHDTAGLEKMGFNRPDSPID